MLSTIYSIGHGCKTESEFITELQSFSIQYLIDVRSSPFSKWAPQYNFDNIKQLIENNGVKYLYWGKSMGGRPVSEECYDEKGFFDYKKMAEVPDFKMGLQRLIKANTDGYRIAIMCSESDPSQCHRSKLIGRELLSGHEIDMQHIVASNKIKTEKEVIIELTKGAWSSNTLFFKNDTIPYFKSRKAYKSVS